MPTNIFMIIITEIYKISTKWKVKMTHLICYTMSSLKRSLLTKCTLVLNIHLTMMVFIFYFKNVLFHYFFYKVVSC